MPSCVYTSITTCIIISGIYIYIYIHIYLCMYKALANVTSHFYQCTHIHYLHVSVCTVPLSLFSVTVSPLQITIWGATT